MIETVLLAVGRDDETRVDELVRHAIDIAKPTDATVIVAHVISKSEYEDEVQSYQDAIDQLGLDVREQDLSPETLAEETDLVGELLERLDDAGIDVETRAALGDEADEIVRIAKDVGSDVLLVGGRKRSPTGKAVFGSTAQEVLLTAPCPVTFVREGAYQE
ncbi:UspA domain-containing protein [Halorubrum saccharovorum DSM 1137]|uniref:UspA domain-containing protein n=1 Tax=Halorubrum saccharovorum DSM 1137 TaxID=1227484 RepID=M0DLJ3_9EURY|nr:universal stress protein [Halorubrum saccharovorum]ELZ36360.1 UspA domain-containing protein [Halorubrum saccharovorum DSM 1137]